MNNSQREACRKRTENLEQDLSGGVAITATRVKKACSDIKELLADVDRLAQAVKEKQHKINALEQFIGPLKDKLSKARQLLKNHKIPNLTPEEKLDLKDVMRGSL